MRLHLGFALILLAACGGGGGGGDDDGDDTPDADTTIPPTTYRIDSLALKDPHLYAFDGSIDVTDVVNEDLANGVTMDEDDPPDGVLDLSVLLVMRPAAPSAASTGLDVVIDAVCTDPIATTECTTDAETEVVSGNAANADADCLAPEDGTTSDYDPPIELPQGRCFGSGPHDVQLGTSIILVLDDARVAGTYGAGDPPGTLTTGLFAGFMTEENAMNTIIPEDTPVVGGDPLSTLLLEEDKDTGPGGEAGWWFYFNFTATTVTYTE